MKRHVTWGFMGVLVLASMAFAQESQPAPQQDQGGRGQRRVRPGQMGAQGMMRDFNQYLNLTPEQQKQVQDIYQKAREERQQQGAGRPQRSPEDRQKTQELRQQLDEAAKAGDDAKVEQLQAELQNVGMSGQFRQQQAKIYDQVEQILTSEQKAKFKEWRTLTESGLPPFLLSNPDALQKAVLKISTLTDIQKNQIEAIFERYNREANSPAATPESKQALAVKTASQVLKELKPSQKALLTTAGRGGRPDRGGRQPGDVGAGANSAGGDTGSPPAGGGANGAGGTGGATGQ